MRHPGCRSVKTGRGWRKDEPVEMTRKKEKKDVKVEAAVVLLERTGDGEQVRKSKAETC